MIAVFCLVPIPMFKQPACQTKKSESKWHKPLGPAYVGTTSKQNTNLAVYMGDPSQKYAHLELDSVPDGIKFFQKRPEQCDVRYSHIYLLPGETNNAWLRKSDFLGMRHPLSQIECLPTCKACFFPATLHLRKNQTSGASRWCKPVATTDYSSRPAAQQCLPTSKASHANQNLQHTANGLNDGFSLYRLHCDVCLPANQQNRESRRKRCAIYWFACKCLQISLHDPP